MPISGTSLVKHNLQILLDGHLVHNPGERVSRQQQHDGTLCFWLSPDTIQSYQYVPWQLV